MYYWIILGIGILITILFLYLRVQKGGLWGLFSKAAASLSFVALGLAGLTLHLEHIGFGTFMLFGLICGMLGDIWLDLKWIYEKDKAVFLYAGFLSFMLGHVAFIIAQHTLLSFTWPQTLASVGIALIIAIVALLLEKPMKIQYGAFKTIVFFYTFVLSLTMTTAMVGTVVTKFTTAWIALSIGSLLFLLSDLVLSGTYFGKGKNTKGQVFLNHILYYGAQFTLASVICLVN